MGNESKVIGLLKLFNGVNPVKWVALNKNILYYKIV